MQQNSSLVGRAPAGLVVMLLLAPKEIGGCFQNAVGNVAGMTAPVVTGYLVASTGNYTAASIVS